MYTTNELLDLMKERFRIQTDSALAEHLKVTRVTVSRLRNGLSSFDDERATKVAEALCLDPFAILASMRVERAERKNNTDKSAFWKKYAVKPHPNRPQFKFEQHALIKSQ